MLNVGHELTLNLKQAIQHIIAYLISLLIKSDIQAARLGYIKQINIYYHDLYTIQLILQKRKLDFNIGTNYITIRVKPAKQTTRCLLIIKPFEQSIQQNDINAVDILDDAAINAIRNTVHNINVVISNAIAKQQQIEINMLTNMNCILFYLIHLEKHQEINKLLTHLIYNSTITYSTRFKYHIYSLYNLVDYQFKKRVWKILSTTFINKNIFDGFIYAANTFILHLMLKDFVDIILVGIINALCYIYSNCAPSYKDFIKLYLQKFNKNVINTLKQNKKDIETKSNSIMAEIIINDIEFHYQEQLELEEQFAYRDKYLLEHKYIDAVYSTIFLQLDITKLIDKTCVIIYCIINNKINRIHALLSIIAPTVNKKKTQIRIN